MPHLHLPLLSQIVQGAVSGSERKDLDEWLKPTGQTVLRAFVLGESISPLLLGSSSLPPPLILFLIFEVTFLSVTLTVLELLLWTRLALNFTEIHLLGLKVWPPPLAS